MLTRFFGKPGPALAPAPLPPSPAVPSAESTPTAAPPRPRTAYGVMIDVLRGLFDGTLIPERGGPRNPPTPEEVDEFLAIFQQHLGERLTSNQIAERFASAIAQLRRAAEDQIGALQNCHRALSQAAERHPGCVGFIGTPLRAIEVFPIGGRFCTVIILDRLPADHPIRSLPASCLHYSGVTNGLTVASLLEEKCPEFATQTALEAGAAALAEEARRRAGAAKQSIEDHTRRAREYDETQKSPMQIMRERLASIERQLATTNAPGGAP